MVRRIISYWFINFEYQSIVFVIRYLYMKTTIKRVLNLVNVQTLYELKRLKQLILPFDATLLYCGRHFFHYNSFKKGKIFAIIQITYYLTKHVPCKWSSYINTFILTINFLKEKICNTQICNLVSVTRIVQT